MLVDHTIRGLTRSGCRLNIPHLRILNDRHCLSGIADQAVCEIRDREPAWRPVVPASHAVCGLPFAFVDLFAGIGGMRLGLEAVGGRSVFASEIDPFCKQTYSAWFGDLPYGDLLHIRPMSIPDHDLLAAGFPCQPFSIAGVSKRRSLKINDGFRCESQGTLFFTLAEIIRVKRPAILVLENVKNLQVHDRGHTWRVIRSTLEDDLDYVVFAKVIDAAYRVPQHRKRIFIVGFDRQLFGNHPPFRYPTLRKNGPKLRDILNNNPAPKFTLSNRLWRSLRRHAKRHRLRGNGFGYGLADLDSASRTLSARYQKDGSEILIRQSGRNPRRLTPRECARLMGFPDRLPIVVSDTQAYHQFGNAVVPPVVEDIGREILNVMTWQLTRGNGCLLRRSDSDQRVAA